MNHIVIMAGGIGSRFWPLSTPDYPKQFIDILGVGRSLIQMTFDRFLPICRPENMWVVTSSHYVDIVKQQLPPLPSPLGSPPCAIKPSTTRWNVRPS